MIPGIAFCHEVTCPFCGQNKKLSSFIGGFCHVDSSLCQDWSDGKYVDPCSFDGISAVQKCPKCGKYYVLSRLKVRSSEGHGDTTGNLTYPETREALIQLSAEGFVDDKEEEKVRFMFHYAYNDFYHRRGENHVTPDASDYELFCCNARWLISNAIKDQLMKAEFYREVGDFKSAQHILDLYAQRFEMIRDRVNRKDNKVFCIPKKECM